MADRERGSQAESAQGTQRRTDPADRPGASGHRFGPDLACSECGILWDVHQREPSPCQSESEPDAFSRRPSADFDAPGSSIAQATGAALSDASSSSRED